MLLIMKNSDDPPVKYLADKVEKFMERPSAEKPQAEARPPLGMSVIDIHSNL